MIKLKNNERLVFAGNTELRAPNGELLPSVPQFVIRNAAEINPADATTLQRGEGLIIAGHAFNEKKKAEERFAALKAGREAPPKENGIPLYVVEDLENLNPKTGLTEEQEYAYAALMGEISTLFSLYVRKMRLAERKGAAT